MPGITGIICDERYKGIDRDLDVMVEAMKNERWYSSGKYTNQDLGIYVGWVNHVGSFSDCMPLVSRDKDYVLIFQGENYLDSNVRTCLERRNPTIDESRADYLLELFREKGDNFLRHLNGWFCGLLIDLRNGKLTLFNDRYGMSRIYYHQAPHTFFFGSEAKSLLKVRSNLRVIDREAMAELLRFNCVTGHRTLFSGISLLPGAASWMFEGTASPRKQRYFEASEWERQEKLSSTEFYEQFAEVVSSMFPKYIQGGQKVALALTAGLDSRLILTATNGVNGRLSCCTYGGSWGETFDIGTARKIADVTHRQFDTIRIDDQFFRNFGAFAWRNIYLSDGTHDAFGAHDIFLNEAARKVAPVRVTGKFGSEVVRDRRLVPWFSYDDAFFQPDFRQLFKQVQVADWSRNRNVLSQTLFEEIPRYEFGRVAAEQSQLTLRTPYMDNVLAKLMYQAPEGIRATGRVQGRYIEERSPDLAAIQTNMGDMGNSSRVLVRLRYLFYMSVFKTEYVYLCATPHWLTRADRKLEKWHLERLLAGREKFEGYRIWLKTELSEFFRETLLSPKAEYGEFFDRRLVRQMLERHVAGTHNYMQELNKALTVELIYKSLLGGGDVRA
jgi:asparagine synthase (glutamine-hydrolysing)